MDLEKMTVAEIKVLAKERGIKNVSALKKSELIEAVNSAQGNIKTEDKESNIKKEEPAEASLKNGNVGPETSGQSDGENMEKSSEIGKKKVSRNNREHKNDKPLSAQENRENVVKEIETLEKIAARYYEKKKEEDGRLDAGATADMGVTANTKVTANNERIGNTKATGNTEAAGDNETTDGTKAGNDVRTIENRQEEDNSRTNFAGRSRDYNRSNDFKARDGKGNEFRQNNRTNDNRINDGNRINDNRQNGFRQNENRQNDSRQRDNRQGDFRQNQQRQEDGRTTQRSEEFRQNQQRQEDGRTTQRSEDSRQPQLEQGAERRGGMYVYPDESYDLKNVLTPEMAQMDSNETKTGILEVCPEGFGFIRSANFLPGENDVYVSPAQIRRLNLKTGDFISGNTRIKTSQEKFSALLYVKSVNGRHPSEAVKRPKFEELTPIFPHERIHLETSGCTPAMRIVDILSPIGKGQRGMIVSQPKAGKTTLLKQIASAIIKNNPEMHVMILLIDERPEEVTDMKESINGDNVEVIYSTFDELPENHKRVSEMVIERAKRLVEHKKDVVILLDSITRLARAYNLTCTSSGRTLSGGLDPVALHMPKKFFGAARCMREGGSLTILATALVETGSRMDDVVFEEFKGTGNMELVLDRNLSERRIFPAIDLPKSSTRRDDLLLSSEEMEANEILRNVFNSSKNGDAVEKIINMFAHTRNNAEFIQLVKKTRFV